MLYVRYPEKRGDWDTIQEENVEMPGEVASANKKLRQGKHTCLVIRMEHPRAYEVH